MSATAKEVEKLMKAPAKKAKPKKTKASTIKKGKEARAKSKTNGKVPADDNRKITITKEAENKSWQEGSLRGQCFDLIKNGMTVKAFIATATKSLKITPAQARGCLTKMDEAPPKQKQRLVVIK